MRFGGPVVPLVSICTATPGRVARSVDRAGRVSSTASADVARARACVDGDRRGPTSALEIVRLAGDAGKVERRDVGAGALEPRAAG